MNRALFELLSRLLGSKEFDDVPERLDGFSWLDDAEQFTQHYGIVEST